ncbi:MAG: PP2C family protein-serine/threonine phosphatase [Planctomycetia bacterium]|nr:PP2C family protein-serine/threonine phosphatase [Planctomycetia bacterium]
MTRAAIANSTDLDLPRATADTYAMSCLELWGGISRVDSGLSVTGLDGWLWSEPAGSDVGGDLCLVSMCACARISRFLLADVTGHGLQAAGLARQLRKLMRRHINTPDQTRLARALNDDFSLLSHDGNFATAILATFFPPTQQFIVCNAGHPRSLLYRAKQTTWEVIKRPAELPNGGTPNLPLGIEPAIGYAQFALRLDPGDMVLFLTDGVIEARDRDGTMLEHQGLLNIVRNSKGSSPESLLAGVRGALRERTSSAGFADDMTLLLLRANGAKPPPQSLIHRMRTMARMLGLRQ